MAAQAALNVNLDQCASKTMPCTWQNGDLNGQNSAYAEGRVVPFRLAIEGLMPGTHTIRLNYDFTGDKNQDRSIQPSALFQPMTPTPTGTSTATATAVPTATPTATRLVEAVAVPIQAGWTSLALPHGDVGSYTASGLLDELATQGLVAHQVARWQDGRWESHLRGFSPNDFRPELGRGYFVRTTNAGFWRAWPRGTLPQPIP